MHDMNFVKIHKICQELGETKTKADVDVLEVWPHLPPFSFPAQQEEKVDYAARFDAIVLAPQDHRGWHSLKDSM